MKLILILISFLCLLPNFDPPQDLTNIGSLRIIVDWGVTLVLSYVIVLCMLRGYSSSFKHRVYCIWLVWMILSQIVLAYCWTPYLSHGLFDPQRYYNYMSYYIQHGYFDTFGLNYRGVLYFYLPFLLTMGLHPLIPMFVNGIMLLVSSLLIIKLFDEQLQKRYLVLLILLPELIWFGVMTSREVPCALALTVTLYGYLKYMESNSQRYLPVIMSGVALMGLIRLPYVFALFMAICVYTSLYAKHKWLVYVSAGISLSVGVYLSAAVGSDVSQSGLASSLMTKVAGENQTWQYANYSENSIARFLIPHNPIQFVLYGILRSICYLLPQPETLRYADSSFTMGNLYIVGLTSVLMYLSIPFVFSYIKRTLTNRGGGMEQMFVIAFLVFWLFIGVCNVAIIHVRYRVVYDLVYISLLIMYFKDTPRAVYLPLFYKWCVASAALFLAYFVLKNLI